MQTKPARRLGADITQTTLQTTLDQSGIDRNITGLSYVEKRLVIVASLLQQVSEANGDWGRTIESVANQTRILSEQWDRFTRALGNVFLPIIQKILPYLNAILMVMTEIVSSIARLLGYNDKDFDYFGTASADMEEYAEGIGTASDNLKKLNRGLRSFDQLNNITTPSTSSAGAGIGLGADEGVMKLFNKTLDEYNNKLQKVQMKATKIRDSIMEWLGFTKKINAITGEVSFEFDHITGGTVLGALVVGGSIYKGISSIINIIKKVGFIKKGATLTTTIGGIATKLATISKVVLALGSAITGTKGIYNAFKNLRKGTDEGAKSFGKYALSVGETIGGFALLGSIIPGVGTLIGSIIGLVVGGTSAFLGYKSAVEEIAYSNVFGDLNISTQEWYDMLNNSYSSLDGYITKMEEYQSTIGGFAETFKQSSDELDLFGYKFGEIGVKISEEDAPKIHNAINNMCESSANIIKTTTDYDLALWGDSFKNMNSITEDEEKNILSHIYEYGQNQQKELKTAQTNITKTYDNAIKTRGYLTDAEYTYIQDQLEKIRKLTEGEMTKNQSNIEYYKTLFADKNLKLDKESYTNFQEALTGYTKEQEDIIEKHYQEQLASAERYRSKEGSNIEIYNGMLKTAYDERVKDTNELRININAIQQDIYKDLANTYKNIYNKTDEESKATKSIIENIFKDINVDPSDIINKFSSAGYNSGLACVKGIQKGFEQNKSSLKFEVPTSRIYEPYKNQNASWVTQNASGGLPSVGQIFIANEKGAELVGHIGGQSFVANQNEIVDFMDKRFEKSNAGLQNATFVIQVGSKEVAREMLTELQDMAISNGKPITIGG